MHLPCFTICTESKLSKSPFGPMSCKIKKYNDLVSTDTLLLSIWKIFHFSSIKQAVFEKAQEAENLPPKNLHDTLVNTR